VRRRGTSEGTSGTLLRDSPTGSGRLGGGAARAVLERTALFARTIVELEGDAHPRAIGYNVYRAEPGGPFRVSVSSELEGIDDTQMGGFEARGGGFLRF